MSDDLTDDACERLTARVIEKLAEKNGHAPEAVAGAVAAENAVVRRSLMRAAYMLGHTVGADELDRLRAQVAALQAERDERIRVLTEALDALDNYVCNNITSDFPTRVDIEAPPFVAARKLAKEARNG